MAGLDGAYIGFDERDIEREFTRAARELEMLHRDITTADIKRLARKALKPMVKAYKEEATIKGPSSFKVWRDGGLYAEIDSGTLAESIGIITTRVRKTSTYTSAQVAPRVKGKFSDPEKGGWFAHFLEYGYLNNGQYRGGGYGFARRAQRKSMMAVTNDFKRFLKSFLNKKVKAARQ